MLERLNSPSPRISVVMAVYKEPVGWICQSINSILDQTFQDFEFIIVNDKPDREENVQLLNEYAQKDDRIKVITNEKNIGLTKSLNKGISVAIGEYIARMDADDISSPNRFELQVNKLSEGYSFVYPNIDYINSNGESIKGAKSSSKFLESEFFIFNPIPHPAVMFRASLLELRNPLYNEKYRRSQDYELWTLFYLNNVRFEKIQDVLLHYRISNSQISHKNNTEQRNDFEAIRENLILRQLNRCGILTNMDVHIELQMNEIYGELLKKYIAKEYISESISAIMYLIAYSIVPKEKKILFNYFSKGIYKSYSFRRNIYLVLRTFGIKTIQFYKLKTYIP